MAGEGTKCFVRSFLKILNNCREGKSGHDSGVVEDCGTSRFFLGVLRTSWLFRDQADVLSQPGGGST